METTTKVEDYTTDATSTVPLDAIQRAALRAKKLNMNRFHKLQRRPKNLAMVPHINVAVDTVDSNLQAAELLGKNKVKINLKNIQKKIFLRKRKL